jgi:hypothetical protein
VQDIHLATVETGPTIPDGATISQGHGDDAVYFVDGKVKRHITSPEVMDQNHFKWPSKRVENSLIQAIPFGRSI